MDQMEKILVTGGSGFIGGHVVDNLLSRGHGVIIFDRYRSYKERKDVEYQYGDVKDWEALSEAIYRCDGVIQLAGILGTQETVRNPKPAVETNILGNLNMFEACNLYGKRGVYITVGNYWMNNPYSITKNTAERFALMYNKERGTKIAIVRGFNAYGPRQKDKPVRKITPNFILPALRNEDILIYGTGEQRMDMIYVSDLSDILVKALVMDHGYYNDVFEGGTGIAPTVNEIAQKVIELSNSKSQLKHTKMRPGEDEKSVVKASETGLKVLNDYLGISNFVSLEEGLKNTIEYYREFCNFT